MYSKYLGIRINLISHNKYRKIFDINQYKL